MNKIDLNFGWDDIWNQWEYKAKNFYPELLEPVQLEHIEFLFDNSSLRIYGYDWIHKNDFSERVSFVTTKPIEFLYFGKSLNKGTLYTAESLVGAKDNKEVLAAIWIYAFVKDQLDVLPESWRGNGYRILKKIADETLQILNNYSISWYHSMRKLLPEDYFGSLLDNIIIDDFSQVIDLAAISASLVNSHYLITLYDSKNN